MDHAALLKIATNFVINHTIMDEKIHCTKHTFLEVLQEVQGLEVTGDKFTSKLEVLEDWIRLPQICKLVAEVLADEHCNPMGIE